MTFLRTIQNQKQHTLCEVDSINNVFNEYSCHILFCYAIFSSYFSKTALNCRNQLMNSVFGHVVTLHKYDSSKHVLTFPSSSETGLKCTDIINSEIWISMQTISSNGLCNFFWMQCVSVVLGHFFFNYIWYFANNHIRYSRQLFYHSNKLAHELHCPKWFLCTTACADFSVSCFDSGDACCNVGTVMTSLLQRLLGERLSAPGVFGILIIPSLSHCESPL